ncbi:lanthionine synthetase C family protein [Stigmatella sp. ncwal1]|uniref:Lanthionine synthetase C family protein n=1 Tax=Stigmatella ashevillensis TaxID=2995309 RepID=A0ABT5D7L8_9BACT|nr:lanthionine synthetase C family protein [Stigmatella ashevillena]MDC0708257.1 lanthionine synthetase C family protein [Stigmatella ashevillena]
MTRVDKDPRAWRPVLDGALAEQARESLEALSRELPPAVASHRDPFLADGLAGVALFFAYLSHVWPRAEYWELAQSLTERSVELLQEMELTPSLFGGFSGVVWTVEHLGSRAIASLEDDLAALDGMVEDWLASAVLPVNYDLSRGLIGMGVHALERLPRPAAQATIERVVHALGRMARQTERGVYWFSERHLSREVRFPRGHTNLGVAHGVPGLIAFLAGAVSAGIARVQAEALLRGAVAWLLAQRNPENGRFPAFIDAEGEPCFTPASWWCYGPPGIASALLLAAEVLGEEGWRRESCAIALKTVEDPIRPPTLPLGLCHGTAGLALIYQRFFQATGDSAFRDAACGCFARTLAQRQPTAGISGYRVWNNEPGVEPHWYNAPGWLEGAAGIGLALLSGLSSIEPAWDRLLLLSLRRDVSRPWGGVLEASPGQPGAHP